MLAFSCISGKQLFQEIYTCFVKVFLLVTFECNVDYGKITLMFSV